MRAIQYSRTDNRTQTGPPLRVSPARYDTLILGAIARRCARSRARITISKQDHRKRAMADATPQIWLASGLRTPFVRVDGALARRDALALSVPVVQAMAQQARGPIDLGVWGAVALNLAYSNLAREVWLDAKLDPHVPTFTTIMQCCTSMMGAFQAAGMLTDGRELALVGGVESMTRVQFGLGENVSVFMRRMAQARDLGARLSLL